MCAPHINMKGIRRSSMIQEIPLKYSDKVVVNNGDDSQSPLASPSKPSAAKELIRTLVVFASMFVVFLLKGNTSLFRFNTPCRISLLREIDRLQHDLESFERLKKQYVDEEVQLQWDNQHILESEDIVTSMVSSSMELSTKFHEEEQHIKETSAHIHEDMQAASKLANVEHQKDDERVHSLSRDVQEMYLQTKHEHEETVALRRQIAETMEELRKQHVIVPQDIYNRLEALEHT